jgi:chromosome segregation ATPase
MMRWLILAVALLLSLTGCNQAHVDDLDSQVADLQAELSESHTRVAQLESELQDARDTIEAGQSALADVASQSREVQSASSELLSITSRFGFDDWQDVVPDIQTAADNVNSAAGALDTSLSNAEIALQ